MVSKKKRKDKKTKPFYEDGFDYEERGNNNYRARYKKMSEVDWYKKAYLGRSIGDIVEIID